MYVIRIVVNEDFEDEEDRNFSLSCYLRELIDKMENECQQDDSIRLYGYNGVIVEMTIEKSSDVARRD